MKRFRAALILGLLLVVGGYAEEAIEQVIRHKHKHDPGNLLDYLTELFCCK